MPWAAFSSGDESPPDPQIQPGLADPLMLVGDAQKHLPCEWDTAQCKLYASSFLVHRVEQTRTKDAVHVERGSDCCSGKSVQPLIRLIETVLGGFWRLGGSPDPIGFFPATIAFSSRTSR